MTTAADITPAEIAVTIKNFFNNIGLVSTPLTDAHYRDLLEQMLDDMTVCDEPRYLYEVSRDKFLEYAKNILDNETWASGSPEVVAYANKIVSTFDQNITLTDDIARVFVSFPHLYRNEKPVNTHAEYLTHKIRMFDTAIVLETWFIYASRMLLDTDEVAAQSIRFKMEHLSIIEKVMSETHTPTGEVLPFSNTYYHQVREVFLDTARATLEAQPNKMDVEAFQEIIAIIDGTPDLTRELVDFLEDFAPAGV